jgi:hypothetical protein
MLVKYIGKAHSVVAEFNGKKYCFNKREPIKDIPMEVYNYIQKSGSIYSEDVIPAPVEHIVPDVKGHFEASGLMNKNIVQKPEKKRGRPTRKVAENEK